jgi:hypothetical protein
MRLALGLSAGVPTRGRKPPARATLSRTASAALRGTVVERHPVYADCARGSRRQLAVMRGQCANVRPNPRQCCALALCPA